MVRNSLTDEQVAEARRLRSTDKTITEIARQFGVSNNVVARHVKGALKVHCRICFDDIPGSDGRKRYCTDECHQLARQRAQATAIGSQRTSARHHARVHLADRYPEEFEALYLAELARRGIEPYDPGDPDDTPDTPDLDPGFDHEPSPQRS